MRCIPAVLYRPVCVEIAGGIPFPGTPCSPHSIVFPVSAAFLRTKDCDAEKIATAQSVCCAFCFCFLPCTGMAQSVLFRVSFARKCRRFIRARGGGVPSAAFGIFCRRSRGRPLSPEDFGKSLLTGVRAGVPLVRPRADAKRGVRKKAGCEGMVKTRGK